MRTLLPKGVCLGFVSIAVMVIAACGTTYTHPNKKMSREDVALDALDCNKAAVLRYKAARINNQSSYEAKQRAVAAARAAGDRCLQARGWKKNQ
jgi:hypothetical protein